MRRGSSWTHEPIGLLAGLSSMAVVAGGCGAGEVLGSGRYNGQLFLITLAVAAILAFIVAFQRRKGQLEKWDLAAEPRAPSSIAALQPLYWIGGGALLLFLVADLTLVEHGGQKAWNVLLWITGAVIGGFMGAYVGLRLSERRWR